MTNQEIKISEEAKRQILLLRNFLKQNAPALYNSWAKKKIAKNKGIKESVTVQDNLPLDKQELIV